MITNPSCTIAHKSDDIGDHLGFVPTCPVRHHYSVYLRKTNFRKFIRELANIQAKLVRTIVKGFHVDFNACLSSGVSSFSAPFEVSLCDSSNWLEPTIFCGGQNYSSRLHTQGVPVQNRNRGNGFKHPGVPFLWKIKVRVFIMIVILTNTALYIFCSTL